MKPCNVLILLIPLLLMQCGSQRDNPADPGAGQNYRRRMGSLETQGERTVLATTELGATFWLRTFEEAIRSVDLIDLDLDGSPEAVIVLGGKTPGVTGSVYVIAAGVRDTLVAHIPPPDSSPLDGGLTSPLYEVRNIQFKPLTDGLHRDILIAYANASFFKSALYLYSFELEENISVTKQGEFWNAGTMGDIFFADLDGDQKDEIVVKVCLNSLPSSLVKALNDTLIWESGGVTFIDTTSSQNIQGLIAFSRIPRKGFGPPWPGPCPYDWCLFFLPKGSINVVYIADYLVRPGLEFLLNASSSEPGYVGDQWYYVTGDGIPYGSSLPPLLEDSRQYGWGLIRGTNVEGLFSFDPKTRRVITLMSQ